MTSTQHKGTDAGTVAQPEPERQDSERVVCGAVLLDGRRALELSAGRLRPEYFADPKHRAIFETACSLDARAESVDITTVRQEILSTRGLELATYLSDLLAATSTVESVPFHARELRRIFVLRELNKLHTGAVESLKNGAARDPGTAMAMVAEALDGLQEELAGTSDIASRAIPGTSLADLVLEPQRSYVGQGMLPAGDITVLVAVAGTGKTWLAFQLAIALSLGDDFLGFNTSKCRVGILELENTMYHVRERMDAVLEHYDGRDRTEALGGLSVLARDTLGRRRIDFDKDWRAIVRWIRAQRLEVAIVDSLQRSHQGDEMSELVRCISAYERIMDATGCALFPLHHERKPAQENGQKKRQPTRADHLAASRGLSMLTDGAKALWRMVDAPIGIRGCTLHFGKVNLGPTPDPVFLTQTDRGTFAVGRAPRDNREMGIANQGAVERAIQAAGVHGIDSAALAKLTGLTARTVQRHATAAGAQQVGGRWILVDQPELPEVAT